MASERMLPSAIEREAARAHSAVVSSALDVLEEVTTFATGRDVDLRCMETKSRGRRGGISSARLETLVTREEAK